MTLLILYVLLALGVSFACSVMEAVLLSITPSHVAVLERRGKPVAIKLRALKDEIDRPLIAILTLNTIAHTVGAAGAGAQAAAVWGDTLVGIFSAVLTLLILVLSEIIPKTLGAVYWRQCAPVVAHSLVALNLALWPIIKPLEGLTWLLSRGKKETGISREEMGALVELAAKHGTLDPKELRLLRNLFQFHTLRANDVMTPRTVVFTLHEQDTVGDVVEKGGTLVFSRIPLRRDNVDQIDGYILKDHLLLEAARDNHDCKLVELKRKLCIVPESAPLSRVLELMLNTREHVALVVDEYGGTAGIVSMEDVVETMLGLEIVDEVDSVTDMQAYARHAWEKRARERGLLGAGAPSDKEAPATQDGTTS